MGKNRRIVVLKSLLVSALVLALGGGAFGSGNGFLNSGDGGNGGALRDTAWVVPVPLNASATCVWGITVNVGTYDGPAPDDPPNACFDGTADAYAAAIARGMQIWGYAWAKDNCVGSTPSAAKSASSVGSATVYIISKPPECIAMIRCDWKPKFKIRAQMFSDDGGWGAAAMMKGVCDTLDADPELVRAIRRQSSSTCTSTVTLGPVTIPWTCAATEAAAEDSPQVYVWDDKTVTACQASWQGCVQVDAVADAGFLNVYAEGQSNVWDSVPGLDLWGRCTNCTGEATVTYGWYP